MYEKGFGGGLWELLRPFGDRIMGRVIVRDGNGLSRTFDDFSVRFIRFGTETTLSNQEIPIVDDTRAPQGCDDMRRTLSRDREALADVEAVLEHHLQHADSFSPVSSGHDRAAPDGYQTSTLSPNYALYLQRLMSDFQIGPHETFAHPVACIIAISSRNETPIEELRSLYTHTKLGDRKLPSWVDSDYLRYYVLVHDEDRDDITRSMALFEQMKRHLGLHCHLLRLRCSPRVETDDDSIPLPRCDWITAAEEIAEYQTSESEGGWDTHTRYIFESDITAITAFVREMVTQSIIPTMERHVSVWNDQVASRRRGLTGRFMNLSRKWTGLGNGSRSSSGGSGSLKEGYDTLGYYRPDSPEAIMRKLADYAFMLRDWKLAYSTYDLLRSDFGDAKAWKYHAAANEMTAVSLLLMSQKAASKARAETVDPMLESALYSYGTRCEASYGALRCLLLGFELLRLQGGPSVDDAARWGLRLLESKLLGRVGDALIRERLASCYGSRSGLGPWGWGSRSRKSATWSVLAADAWCKQAKYIPARKCLSDAHRAYESLSDRQGSLQFADALKAMNSLQDTLRNGLHLGKNEPGAAGTEGDGNFIEEEKEALMDIRPRRMSVAAPGGILETAPLHGDEPSQASGPSAGTKGGFG